MVTKRVPPVDEHEVGKDLARRIDDSATRAEAATNMRLAGAPWDQIARVLDYVDENEARTAVEKALAASASEYEDRDRLRLIMNKQMDRLMNAAFQRGIDKRDSDQGMFMRNWIALADRKARLNGLDKQLPVVISPAFEDIYNWALEAARSAAAEPIVIEAEIIDDDQ